MSQEKTKAFFKQWGLRPSALMEEALSLLLEEEYQRGYEQGSLDQSVTEILWRMDEK